MAFTCAVTGGRGYVGSQLIKQLLEKGYNVRATVRNDYQQNSNQPLIALGAAFPGKLELVEADLLKDGSFDSAFNGVDFIFHVASPFYIEADDPQSQLVNIAVDGTRNVLLAASRNKATLKRIVVTSSCAAVKGMKPNPPQNGKTYSEVDWNDTSTVESGEAYWVGKTEAEKAAWALAKEHELDLVTILPEFIMGPLIIGRLDGTSMGYMKGWVEGKFQKGAPVFADVRDVARAHILAAENPSASGRYIVANSHSAPDHQISNWLKTRFSDYEFESAESGEKSEELIDNSRVQRELGLAITPVKETVIDMAVTLIQLGLAQPKKKSG